MVAMLLRLFATPAPPFDAVFDSAVRDAILPRYLATPGIVDVLVGRDGETGGRLLISVWEEASLPDDGIDAAPVGGSGSAGEVIGPPEARSLEGELRLLPVAVAVVPADRAVHPRVIRVFHGRVREDQLATYVEEVRRGATADASGGGLVALYLATDGDREFVTVSAWTDWDSLSRATGGDTRQPDRTRHAERLESWTVQHLEAIPAVPPPATTSRA